VLQAHRIARRQRNATNPANATREARDALAKASRVLRLRSWADGQRSSTAIAEGNGSERRVLIAGLLAALQEFVNPDLTAASIRTFFNERIHENGTHNHSSIITSSSLERLTPTPPHLQASSSDSPNNPWAEIEAPYRSRYGDPPRDSTVTGSSLEPEAYSQAQIPGNYGAGMAQLAGTSAITNIPGGDSGDETL
jgi:hypothetical protein